MKSTFARPANSVKLLLPVFFLISSVLCSAQSYLYGLTQNGGVNNKGVPYRIKTNGSGFISYTDFNGSNGDKPGKGAGFVQYNGNDLAGGLTALTEANSGIGNRINIQSKQGGILPAPSISFSIDGAGINPAGRLLLAYDGRLYGLTSARATNNAGALFSTSTTGSGVTYNALLPSIARSPKGSLVQGSGGSLYGMAEFGGAYDKGTIFSYNISESTRAFLKLLDFSGSATGSNPTGNLLFASDGKLYGMTQKGGAYGHGVIFSILPDGTDFKKIHDFDGVITGSSPQGSLVEFTDGQLYGMTSSGGAKGFGVIFKITTSGAFTKILDFEGTNGMTPLGDLLVSTDGTTLYGTTYAGGVYDKGVLFELVNGDDFNVLFSYSASKGCNPVGTLTMLREFPKMSFTPIPEKNTLSETFTPSVETISNLPVYFASDNSAVAVVENNQIKIKGEGAAYITAYQLGNYKYNPQSAKQLLIVRKVKQTITFPPIPAKTFGDASFQITATASSGLPVTFTIYYNDVAKLVDNTVSIIGSGKVMIYAKQSGNSIYEAAEETSQEFLVNQAEQIISFAPDPIQACCQSFELKASSTSNLSVYFKTPDRDKLKIEGSYAEILRPGVVNLVAYQPGNKNYKSTEKQVSINVVKGTQTIFFNLNKTTFTQGDQPYYVQSWSTSGLPITYTSNPPGIAVVEGSQLYILGLGTTTITASQQGNDKYAAAPPTSIVVTVEPLQAPVSGNIISWPDLLTRKATDAPFNLVASASSGLPVSYTSSNNAVAVISGNQVTIKGVGSTIITARQDGNDRIPAATPIQKILTIEKDYQYIYMPNLYSVDYGEEPVELPMVSTQGLPIVYSSSDNNIASVDNYLLRFNGTGKVSITAAQPGNEYYLPAENISQEFSVYPIYQNIVFDNIPSKTYGDIPFTITAKTSSGRPVTFTSSNPEIVSVEGATVSIKGAGTVTIKAYQSGYPGYYYAEASKQLVINKAQQSITFSELTDRKFGDTPFTVSATASSGLPVSFASGKPSVARVSGDIVTITGNGVADIIALQPGNENYLPAENVLRQFSISDIGNNYDLIGTALSGGANGSGIVYSIDSDGSDFHLLKQFNSRTLPSPSAGFIKGNDGKLYGNFQNGGSDNGGHIIRLEPDGSGLTMLYEYKQSTGSWPFGNLMQAKNGDLYGMTQSGGAYNGGTVFKIRPDGNGYTVLYNFNSESGTGPLGGLLQASDGKLYGVTQNEGFFGAGSIFSMNDDGSDFAIVFYFNNNAPINSGYYSRGSLIQGADGFLYGSLFQGGAGGKGTIFKIHTDGTGFKVIFNFSGNIVTGGNPASTLLLGTDGKIYGMTQTGGLNNLGIIFSIAIDGSNFIKLLDFDGPVKGASPAGQLTEGTNGIIYGMTNRGGLNDLGTIFAINKNGTGFHKMADLKSDAASPVFGPLTESTPGVFFGMTYKGGSINGGAIFSINSSSDELKVVKDFTQDEVRPSILVSDSRGDYHFGIATEGGISGNGAIYRINTSGTYERIFNVPSGTNIVRLFYISTGHLWILANENGVGYIFKIKSDGSDYQRVISFDNSISKGRDGQWLIEATDGFIYGVARGGTNGSSLVFKIKSDGSEFAKVLDMPAGIETSSCAFIQASDGNFYGCTVYRSHLYKFTPSGTFTNVFTFPSEAGEVPMKIIEMNGGALGIITRDHGSGGYGSIFTVEKDGSSYAKIYNPKPTDGIVPMDMLQTFDGWIFVVTNDDEINSSGTIYKIKGDGSSFKKIRQFSKEEGSKPVSLVFKKASQSFTFEPLPVKKVSDLPFDPIVVSSSGAPIDFSSSNTNVAIIENGKVKPVGSGVTIIRASLPANTNFFEASYIDRELVVTKNEQYIEFINPGTKQIGGEQFSLEAIASSGLGISYSTQSDKISLEGAVVTVMKAGQVTIKASQDGNEKFAAASAFVTFCINPPLPIINFDNATKLRSSNREGNQWYLNGEAIPDATAETLLVSESGSYTVKTTIDECSSDFSFPQILTVTAVEKPSDNEVKISPNPVTRKCTVKVDASFSGNVYVSLLNATGRVLETHEMTSKREVNFDLSETASGLYIVKVVSNEKVLIYKLLKL